MCRCAGLIKTFIVRICSKGRLLGDIAGTKRAHQHEILRPFLCPKNQMIFMKLSDSMSSDFYSMSAWKNNATTSCSGNPILPHEAQNNETQAGIIIVSDYISDKPNFHRKNA